MDENGSENRDEGDNNALSDTGPEIIQLKYLRPPDRHVTYRHVLIKDMGDVIVQAFTYSTLREDFLIDGKRLIEKGDRAIYFEFANEWYNIIKVYKPDGRFIGYYCDINTPIERFDGGYRCTDLFLDLWVYPSRYGMTILDEDEFREAIDKGWIDQETAENAKRALDELIANFKRSEYPPEIMSGWGFKDIVHWEEG